MRSLNPTLLSRFHSEYVLTYRDTAIESRVARIKARVAELTGNMEETSGPGARSTPPPQQHQP